MLLLTVASLAGMASNPARRAWCSVRAFADYYEVLGATIHPSAWDRVTLSATLAVANPTSSRHRACSEDGARP